MNTEDIRPEFIIYTEEIYKSFELEIEKLRQCPPSKNTDVNLRGIIVSAYIKAYDFIRYICLLNDHKTAFFQIPMLRGICEDLISISYLLNQSCEKQNYLLLKNQIERLNKSTKAQKDFFIKNNKGQIVPPIVFEDIDKCLDAYKSAGTKLEKNNFPNVFKMAEQTGMMDLYKFIYHATSKSVHFDEFTLLSMGWGPIDREKGTIEANFSYKHDYAHYYTFVLFYSSYLFIHQTKKFKEFLGLSKLIESRMLGLEEAYKEINWPTLITFNQMNMKSPNFVFRKMFRKIQSNNIKKL